MVWLLSILLPIYWMAAKKEDIEFKLFILTSIVSVFFFGAVFPFIEIPVFFVLMCISIIYSLLNNSTSMRVNKSQIFLLVVIVLLMIIQILNIVLQKNVCETLLIGKSLTDTFEIINELYLPVLDGVVIKHFIFYVIYLVYLMSNFQHLKNVNNCYKLKKIFTTVFKIIFVALIVEFSIANTLPNFNDRQLMSTIFGVRINQKYNWETFGFKSVALFYTERSEMANVLIYYLFRLSNIKSKNYKEFIWDIISFFAVIVTGSSTALVIALIYMIIILICNLNLLYNRNIVKQIIILVPIVVAIVLLLNNFEFFFYKIESFISGEKEWGSGYFRRNSIEYALQAVYESPLIGLGIGTVYCHSSLVQTVANIGVVGTLLMVGFHLTMVKNIKMSPMVVIKIIFLIFVTTSAFMIQQITSPMFMMFIFALFYRKEYEDADVSNYGRR